MTRIPVSAAKGQLADLVRRAEAGEEIVLTRHGTAVVSLAPVAARVSPERRRAVMLAAVRSAARTLTTGPDAARSQDFLYDDAGLPD